MEEIKEHGYDLSARNPNRTETEILPPPAEIAAGLLEKEKAILGIIEEINELLNNRNKLEKKV